MSIIENISRSTEEIKESIELDLKDSNYDSAITDNISTIFSSNLMPKTKSSKYLKAATGWVYGCVGVIADEVAGIQLHLMKVDKKGDQVEVDDHEALDLIYRANNAMTRFDLIQLTFQYLELTGEAPWYISFGKGGKPDQIILLRPDRLTVVPGREGEMIGGYKYSVYGEGGRQEIPLEPEEVVHLKYSDPDNPLRGKGPLQAAAITYDLDNYAERWNSQFFRNSASPSAALQTDKVLAKDVRARVEARLKENYQGLANAHKTMILENGLKWQQISLSQKDMDFIEQEKFSRDKLMAIFRVPRTALGITDDVNRANAEATDYVFAKRTIKPKMMRFVEQLNEFLLPLFPGTENMFFTFDDPVPENIDQKIKLAQTGLQAGFMTVNESREIMGLDPLADGDVLRDPTSFNPVVNNEGKALKAKRNLRKKATKYQVHLQKARTRKTVDEAKKLKFVEKVVEESVVPMVFNMLKQNAPRIHKRPFTKGSAEEIKQEKYNFQSKQLNIADQYEEKVIAKLNIAFGHQKDIAMRQIANGQKPKMLEDVEVQRYTKLLRGPMTQLMREQANLAFQILGVNHEFAGEGKAAKPLTFLQRLSQFFDVRVFRLGTEITKETNSKLADAFKEGLEKEESIPVLQKRISQVFDDMEDYRSERIARTETILSSNYATNEAYKESGVVEAKEWLATMDERTDDECAELDGKVVELDGDFFDGDYFDGQTPPIHANCRCTIIPIVRAG